MSVLTKLTLKNLKLNKKRSIGTIIGIILSVALICAIGGMVISYQASVVQVNIDQSGYYHLKLQELSKDDLKNIKLNVDVKTVNEVYDLGHAKLPVETEGLPYTRVYGMSEAVFKNIAYILEEGTFPKNNNEIIISKTLQKQQNLNIGDYIELDIGKRQTIDGDNLNDTDPFQSENEHLVNIEHYQYKVVGICSKAYYNYYAYAITTNQTNDDLEAYIALKNPNDYKDSITQLLGVDRYENIIIGGTNARYNLAEINSELLRWELLEFSDSTTQTLSAVVGVVLFIILLTSVFCIRNSFAISVTEKMKMYGMLASVGATKKQIRQSVIIEGLLLGIIGIPLGISLGVFTDYLLVKVVNALLGESIFDNMTRLVFTISPFPIILAVILGVLTIYLSSITSAIQASKVSPIDNLRNINEIKMNKKRLKVPKIIKIIFNTGGVIAYKNLQRSKKKYRTTVISLAISIFVFISMSAFMYEALAQANDAYVIYDYNISILGLNEEKIDDVLALDHIETSYLLYECTELTKIYDLSKINLSFDEGDHPYELFEDYDEEGNLRGKCAPITITALDDESFRAYTKKIGVSYDQVKDQCILIPDYKYYSETDSKYKTIECFTYDKGDIIPFKYGDENIDRTIQIGAISDIRPYGIEGLQAPFGFIVVNKDYHPEIDFNLRNISIQSTDSEILVMDIENIDDEAYVNNIEASVRRQKSILYIISIFLYGFIIVITLIGMTNIFNTITSNMELRSKEFAMLKSVGMTKEEFDRMINLETLFYSLKSIFFGTVLGIIGAYLIHSLHNDYSKTPFVLPYNSILICFVFVFMFVHIIMKYSIYKINQQNTIETIRNDNV